MGTWFFKLTVGDFTTDEDIDYILEHLPKVIERLRGLSPLYQTYLKEQKKRLNNKLKKIKY